MYKLLYLFIIVVHIYYNMFASLAAQNQVATILHLKTNQFVKNK